MCRPDLKPSGPVFRNLLLTYDLGKFSVTNCARLPSYFIKENYYIFFFTFAFKHEFSLQNDISNVHQK
jgi:hypothetical protein